MNPTAASAELLETMGRAEVALSSGDMEGASDEMGAAADLCRRLQAAGMNLRGPVLDQLRELSERCGLQLTRLSRELWNDSARGETLRRGLASYQSGR